MTEPSAGPDATHDRAYRSPQAAVLVWFHSRRGRLALTGLAAALLAIAITLLVIGLNGQQRPPSPPAAAADSVAVASTTVVPTLAPSKTAQPKRSSSPTAAEKLTAPMQITIPAIDVHADVVNLGLNSDRTVQVPPLDKVSEAGWYEYSPVPGQLGPSVILGHIDSAVSGRGVFFELGALRQGDTVSVLRPDHLIANFVVNRVAEFPKTAFPTQQIYGNTSTADLRLVTCGGHFDQAARSYVDNIVAFATLTSLRPE